MAGCRAPEPALRDTTMDVTLDRGGARAGYAASSALPVCSRDLAGPGSWTVQYTDTETDSGVASLQLVVPRGADAPGGSDSLHLSLAVGAAPDDSVHVIETRAAAGVPQGEGHVAALGGPDTALIVARGRAGSGAMLEATIRCGQVRRADRRR